MTTSSVSVTSCVTVVFRFGTRRSDGSGIAAPIEQRRTGLAFPARELPAPIFACSKQTVLARSNWRSGCENFLQAGFTNRAEWQVAAEDAWIHGTVVAHGG